MNEKEIRETILETIFLLTDLNWKNFRRHIKPFKTHNPVNLESWISSFRDGNIPIKEVDKIIGIAISNLQGPRKEQEEIISVIIKLNKMLKKKKRIKPILSIAEKMEKIQSKRFITIDDFSEIYNVSKSTQQNYRGKDDDPLPYLQPISKGRITYDVEEVRKWFERNNK